MSTAKATFMVTLSILVLAGGAAKAGRYNLSSHAPEFFSELLTNRVWVFHAPEWDVVSEKDVTTAFFHHPNGTLSRCPKGRKATWGLMPGRGFFVRYNYQPVTAGKGIPQGWWQFAIHYHGETGVLRSEAFKEHREEHIVLMDGWVQDSWPAVMKKKCPYLDIPLPVNERQTATDLMEMMQQDPEAPIRRFPGYEISAPGATGIGAAGGGPTMSKEDFSEFLRNHNGYIGLSSWLRRYVLILNEKVDQIWQLDEQGDEITDIGHLALSPNGGRLTIEFDGKALTATYHVGYPFFYMPTGERYAAMRLMDWLIAQEDYVELPFMDREAVSFRFLEDGALQAAAAGGGHIGGAWWWSRGRLVLSLEGVKKAAGFEWPKLARHVGWPEAPPLVEGKKKGDRDSGNRDSFKRPER